MAQHPVEYVHNFPIIAQHVTKGGNGTRPGRIILVDRGPDPVVPSSAYDRYVVSWQGGSEGAWDHEWDSGAYYIKLSEAAAVYERRVEREQGRVS